MSSLSVAYLEWARVFMGRARYDLASSGIRTPRFEESFGEIDFNDLSAIGKLPAAIAAYHDLPTETVTPALGTSHAIWLAYASLLSPGDEVLVERPVYEPLHRVPESLGARVSFFDRSAPPIMRSTSPRFSVHAPRKPAWSRSPTFTTRPGFAHPTRLFAISPMLCRNAAALF